MLENNDRMNEFFKENKKAIGKIIVYDGEVGIIRHENENYYFTKKDVYSEYLKEGSTVEFYKNKLPFGDDMILMARNIENTIKEDMYNPKKGKQ